MSGCPRCAKKKCAGGRGVLLEVALAVVIGALLAFVLLEMFLAGEPQ